jgi:hypothetical protein
MEPEAAKPEQSAPQEQQKSKKWLYIIGAVVILLILGKFVMGGVGYSVNGVNVNRALDGSATFTNNEGSVTVGATKLPDNWPSDAPTYANAQIQTAMASNPQTGQAGSAVVFTTSDSAQTVADFYKKDLAAKGWKVEQTVSTGQGTMLGATKDTRTFGVYIVDSGDGKVSVTASVSLSQ